MELLEKKKEELRREKVRGGDSLSLWRWDC